MKQLLSYLFIIIACMVMTACIEYDTEANDYRECYIELKFEDEAGNSLTDELNIKKSYPPEGREEAVQLHIDHSEYKVRQQITEPSDKWSDEIFPENTALKQYVASNQEDLLDIVDKNVIKCSSYYPIPLCMHHVISHFITCPKIFGDNEEHEIKAYVRFSSNGWQFICYRLEYEGEEMKPLLENRFLVTIKRHAN